jgi:phosphatidylserine synthase
MLETVALYVYIFGVVVCLVTLIVISNIEVYKYGDEIRYDSEIIVGAFAVCFMWPVAVAMLWLYVVFLVTEKMLTYPGRSLRKNKNKDSQ